MYKALYRKYRPQTFADVIGQPHITVTLKNEIKNNRIGHAYLFIGSRGTGKTTCAKIFAKAVNCFNSKDGDPCCDCDICKNMVNGEAMDIVELDAASNNSVNDIREICESAQFTPVKCKYRVYIIDEVHMLSQGAFNALLKTLEEPPAHVIFILATTEVHKVPATILSRCQRFEFHRISAEDIAYRLIYVAKCEGSDIKEDAALYIGRIADGAMRDALAILDKCISTDKNINLELVMKVLGLANIDYIFDLIQAIIDSKPEDALMLIDKLNMESKDMVRLCNELIGHFRNLMLIKTVSAPKKLILLPDNDYERLLDLSKHFSLPKVIGILDTLQESFERMSKGCNGRTEMEMSLVKLCCNKVDNNNLQLEQRLDKLESLIENMESTVSVKKNTKNLKENEKKEFNLNDKSDTIKSSESEGPTFSTQVNLEDLKKQAIKMQNWNEVLEILKNYSKTIAMAFKGSMAYISGDFVLIDAKNEVAFELLRKSAQRDKMRTAIKEVTGRLYKLGPYKPTIEDKDVDPLDALADIARNFGIKVNES